MNTHLENCPLCNSGQFKLYLNCKDHSLSQEVFPIQECQNCHFKFTNPRPAEKDLGRYYGSDNYISHTNKSNNLINRLYKIARVYTIQQKSRLLGKWAVKGKLLDIGCGTGEFVAFNKQQGWQVEGVELNAMAREKAENQLGQPIYTELKEISSEQSFQAITLWHVLEHVADLKETCRQIVDLLAPKGTIIIAVPNYKSFDAQYYQGYWAAYDVPRHLYHFSPSSMEKLWHSFGMNIKAILPMPLDAYYVSMLSEKYQAGKSNMLKASWIAMRANQKAKTSGQYSSLIYIIRK